MKKLGKKSNCQRESIEAYTETCYCRCFCESPEMTTEEYNIERVYVGTGAKI